jgi:hypothetical protein
MRIRDYKQRMYYDAFRSGNFFYKTFDKFTINSYTQIEEGDTMKKYISGLLTGLLIAFLSLGTYAAVVNLIAVPSPFPILIDGKKADIGAYSISGSTYIKLADLKAAGVEARLNIDKKQIEINTNKGATTEAEPVLNEAIPEYEAVNNSVLEVTSARTVDSLTVYMAGGKEYVYRWDVISALQKKNESDNSKYKDSASYYLDLSLDSASGLKDVILTVDVWGTNENVKPVNLSEPIKITNLMVYKRFEPRLPNDNRKMECIKLDDYEKYIKSILDSDKTLEEIYNSYTK